jgi:hypothetical protein
MSLVRFVAVPTMVASCKNLADAEGRVKMRRTLQVVR